MPDLGDLRRTGPNAIEVVTNDGNHHNFTPQVLDVLLESYRVVKFRRASGWVTVGVDPIRTKSGRESSYLYIGHERRSTH